MRPCDVDTSGPVWIYTPRKHKTLHHGHAREIYLGPKAQAVLAPWLRRRSNPEEFLFSPQEAETERNAQRSSERKTARYPSHTRRNASKRRGRPGRAKRERYDVDSYRRAIEYGCRRADQKARAEALAIIQEQQPNAPVPALDAHVFVPIWSPGQLRHNAGTTIRREYGIELARIVLGHSTMNTTEIRPRGHGVRGQRPPHPDRLFPARVRRAAGNAHGSIRRSARTRWLTPDVLPRHSARHARVLDHHRPGGAGLRPQVILPVSRRPDVPRRRCSPLQR
jgi:hypothetical protein